MKNLPKTNSHKSNNRITSLKFNKMYLLTIFYYLLFLLSSSTLQAVIKSTADPYYEFSEPKGRIAIGHLLANKIEDGDVIDTLKEARPSLIGSLDIPPYQIPREALNNIRHPWFFDWHAKAKAENAAEAVNTYVINVSAASFSAAKTVPVSLEDTDDYYDILLDFQPTASRELTENFFLPAGYHLKIYPTSLDINNGNLVPTTKIQESTCKLAPWDWCPRNTMDKKTTYSESMQFTLGGNIGGGPTPSGSVSPSYSISHQYTRDIMDVDVVSIMNLNQATWNIKYNRLSLKEKHGFKPDGTLQQSLRWVWKVNRKEAFESLYVWNFSDDPTQRYLPLKIELFAEFARMHQTFKMLEDERTPPLLVAEDIILLKTPGAPTGKTTIVKDEHRIKPL